MKCRRLATRSDFDLIVESFGGVVDEAGQRAPGLDPVVFPEGEDGVVGAEAEAVAQRDVEVVVAAFTPGVSLRPLGV